MSCNGVSGVHDIISHKYGQIGIISLHIEVSDKDSAFKLHAISEEVEDKITKKLGAMTIVHIDPINKDHPRYKEIDRAVKEIIGEDKRIGSFHELRIIGNNINKCKVVFDIALEEDTDELETYDIVQSIRKKFKNTFPEMKAIVKVEPKYVYNVQV